MKQVLTAILTSPRFLFLDEGGAKGAKQLDDFQLATRLSYALWCSTPDERLLKLAAEGILNQPKTLKAETERLLRDPRSQAFVQRFADAWLRLDKIGSMPPGTKQFPVYFRDRLESAMKNETYHFVSHVLQRNRPLSEFIDARYSFLNGALARLMKCLALWGGISTCSLLLKLAVEDCQPCQCADRHGERCGNIARDPGCLGIGKSTGHASFAAATGCAAN